MQGIAGDSTHWSPNKWNWHLPKRRSHPPGGVSKVVRNIETNAAVVLERAFQQAIIPTPILPPTLQPCDEPVGMPRIRTTVIQKPQCWGTFAGSLRILNICTIIGMGQHPRFMMLRNLASGSPPNMRFRALSWMTRDSAEKNFQDIKSIAF